MSTLYPCFRFSIKMHSCVFSAKPYWVEKPRAIETRIGSNATFICKAGGIPTPQISWYINGVPMSGMYM